MNNPSVAGAVARLARRSSSVIFMLAVMLSVVAPAHATVVTVTNLVTDDQGANPAQVTDVSLRNAWGIANSPTGAFWVSDNATGVSTIYSVNPASNATSKAGLTVSIPGAGNVTGQVFNTAASGGSFNGDAFLFVSEDGTVSGWRGALGTTAETLVLASNANLYKGAAFATLGADSYLYAANFRNGTVDVIKGGASAPNLAGNFVDPGIPAGYAPFGIRNLGGTLYVTYALQDGTQTDDVAGAGNGFVSAFDLNGNFLRRVASGGSLNSPWGLVIAPLSFGALAGDLLVGNFGDGRISAFDAVTDAYVGQLLDASSNPVSIDGLWGLTVGNGGNGGSASALYFSAGPGGEEHGLFGVISAVPEPGSLALFAFGLLVIGLVRAARGKRM